DESDIYNVGTGIETNVNELYNMLNDISGNGQEEKHGPAAAGEQMRSVITSEKLFEKFNWKPSTKLIDGLKETVEFFKKTI
ncbi:MAG: UDP-glucose 4-epimerase, partial [Ignavibacteriaceae bacterium]